MINYHAVRYTVGYMLLFIAAFMLTVIPVSLWYSEDDWFGILISALITAGTGWGLKTYSAAGRENDITANIHHREGFLIVALCWVAMTVTGSLPFLLTGAIPDYTDAFFETISGFTTTGASVLQVIEPLPKGVLYWRSLIQWIGGMGIIVMFIAIMPVLGIGGVDLFAAETPGPTKDKIHPRIKETAKRLWAIYLGLTIIEVLLLWLEGMGLYDAINHSFTTLSTGGYSTHTDSIAYFRNPLIHYTIIVFMFLGGFNFTLIYFTTTGQFRRVAGNEEFRFYLKCIFGSTAIVFICLFLLRDIDFETAFRNSLFQVISIVTTTGFATADYTSWHPFLTIFFFLLLFTGGCAGSTGGGIKMIRHLMMYKNCFLEFRRLLHPNAVINIKTDGNLIPQRLITLVMVFVLLYLVVFVTGVIFLASCGVDFETAAGASATCIGNVGPGIGAVGPVSNYSQIPDAGKWFLCLEMLIGRLEVFTILILFSRVFWQRNG